MHLIQGMKNERAPDGVKVTQSGQIFTINNLQISDKGTYHCKVQSTFLKIESMYPFKYGSKEGNQIVCYVIH